MNIEPNPREALLNFLSIQPDGAIQDTRTLSSLLTNTWSTIQGSSDQKTFASKLYRMESCQWNNPLLKFIMERHGRTVNQSSRADLHQWEVDVSSWTAKIIKTTYRQLRPQAKRMDVKPFAKEVADAIINSAPHRWIDYKNDGSIHVLIGEIIAEGYKETTLKRRKRFREALTPLLTPHGWRERSPNYWVHTSTPS